MSHRSNAAGSRAGSPTFQSQLAVFLQLRDLRARGKGRIVGLKDKSAHRTSARYENCSRKSQPPCVAASPPPASARGLSDRDCRD